MRRANPGSTTLPSAAIGLASHAATIARELGLPAVIGDTTAVKRFRTGDLIVVNPVDRSVVLAAG